MTMTLSNGNTQSIPLIIGKAKRGKIGDNKPPVEPPIDLDLVEYVQLREERKVLDAQVAKLQKRLDALLVPNRPKWLAQCVHLTDTHRVIFVEQEVAAEVVPRSAYKKLACTFTPLNVAGVPIKNV